MNLEENILLQIGQSYRSISDSFSHVSHFFSTFKPILAMMLCNEVNTQRFKYRAVTEFFIVA